jgi:hypothetical protein
VRAWFADVLELKTILLRIVAGGLAMRYEVTRHVTGVRSANLESRFATMHEFRWTAVTGTRRTAPHSDESTRSPEVPAVPPSPRKRPRRQHAPLPAYRAIDHVTAALLEVQRLRRASAPEVPLDDGLARVETELRGAADALYDVTGIPASWRTLGAASDEQIQRPHRPHNPSAGRGR